MRLLLLVAAAAAGCAPVCVEDEDCGEGFECVDRRCRIQREDLDHVDLTDGWSSPVGDGVAYTISDIVIAEENEGFDIDGWCPGGRCVDNRLSKLGPIHNGDFRNLQFFRERSLLEITGIDEPFHGDDIRVTLRAYEGVQGDFGFEVSERSLVGGAPRWRVPGRYSMWTAHKAGEGTLSILLPFRGRAVLMELHRAAFEVRSPPELGSSVSVNLGGVLTARDLAMTNNPTCADAVGGFCSAVDASLLDAVVVMGLQPDIDLDGDGLETFELDRDRGRVFDCFDGCTEGCPAALPVAPTDLDEPWSCALRDQMADGYSISFLLSGRQSRISDG